MYSKLMKLSFAMFMLASLSYGDCRLIAIENYMRVGDVDGKEIFEKTDYTYECNTTKVSQGPCLAWSTDKEEINTDYHHGTVYKEDSFNGSATAMFNLIGAYNGVQFMWAGWKGICRKGTVTDFSWASDPLYWAGLALQVSGGMSGNNATTAKQAADAAVKQAAKSYISTYGQCVVQAGIGAASMLTKINDDKDPCDPVDEICESDEGDTPDQYLTIDKQGWDNLVLQNPDIVNYVTIVSEENGILVIKFNPNDGIKADMSKLDKSAKEAKDKAKKMQLMFGAIKVGATAAVCAGKAAFGMGSQAAVSSAGSSNSSLTSAKSLVTGMIGAINPLLGASLDLLMNFVSSFQDVNSCDNMEDAQAQGSRHLKTFTHKKYDMCHMYEIKKRGNFIASYRDFHYCCYPDVTSRILVEQIKAQLGRGWEHCTDVTIQDLEKIDFKACTAEQKADPSVLDGKSILGTESQATRERAYQFKYKCIDFKDLEDYLAKQIGTGSIGIYKLEDQFQKLQSDDFQLPDTKTTGQ